MEDSYTWRSGQDGSSLADNIFIGIFTNENWWTVIQISLEIVPEFTIDN